MIYLDNAATTKVFDEAVSAAAQMMTDNFYNPNATYTHGVAVKSFIESCRKEIAKYLGAEDKEIIFTSCATESNNWVFSQGRKRPSGNIVISAGEHSSVYEPAMRLKSRGTDVRIAKLDKSGRVDTDDLLRLVDDNTSLVSVIHVSNETGVINPIKDICSAVKRKSKNALFHSDGVQGALKSDSVDSLGVDYYSVSAHKMGAPKGIGLLYVNKKLNIAPMLVGGGQERGLRSGTQNTAYIAAFAAAVKQFIKTRDLERTHAIRNKLVELFTDSGAKIIGDRSNSGYILCVCLNGAKAEIVQNAACDRGVVIGKGAACSGSKRGNRVLSAMGLSDSEVERCIRISLCNDTSMGDAVTASEIILECAYKIRRGNV
ncbi:MAG: cysteine desulfurase [Clostridiales bacterium]|nr:cysteine desulfurase [Clostridiales bacterium]